MSLQQSNPSFSERKGKGPKEGIADSDPRENIDIFLVSHAFIQIDLDEWVHDDDGHHLVRFPNCIVYKVEVWDPDYQ